MTQFYGESQKGGAPFIKLPHILNAVSASVFIGVIATTFGFSLSAFVFVPAGCPENVVSRILRAMLGHWIFGRKYPRVVRFFFRIDPNDQR